MYQHLISALARHEAAGASPEEAVLLLSCDLMAPSDLARVERRKVRTLRETIERDWGNVLRSLMNVGDFFGWVLTKCISERDAGELHYALCYLAFEANRTLSAIVNQNRSALAAETFGYLRAMHEILVKSHFLRKHVGNDPDLPGRYILHVSKTYAEINRKVTLIYGDNRAQSNWDSVVSEYGNRFTVHGKRDYGWAYPSINRKSPTFSDLMEDCDFKSEFSSFFYSMSTSKVHGDLVWNPTIVYPDSLAHRIDSFSSGDVGLVMELTLPLYKEILGGVSWSCTESDRLRVLSVLEETVRAIQGSVARIIETDPDLHLGLNVKSLIVPELS